MRGATFSSDYICARCLRASAQQRSLRTKRISRPFSSTSPHQDSQDGGGKSKGGGKEMGAMSRRLADMSEEALETGGRSARKAVSEAGFSEDLKSQLEERIRDASFRSQNAQAFATAGLSSTAGAQIRDIAGAQPWTGTESVEDASLRMLNDSFKPLKVPARATGGVRMPKKVDTGNSRTKASTGGRLASARDKTSIYSFLKDPNLDPKEREKIREQLKERFQPGARAVPATIQGLASLAEQRIEDAIARGQFKNLPRGQKIERDYNASSPFLDTTEYFMNKIIQRQDIVPPWIEKQQELVSTATKFRGRLRADWKRHVARTIASKGGGLEKQIRLAEEYAAAELIENPQKPKVEKINTVDEGGQMSQITLAGELKEGLADGTPSAITVTEEAIDSTGQTQGTETEITVTPAEAQIVSTPPPPPRPSVPPFRDPDWLAIERSYHRLAVENLNTITRSYNLMAPNLAKKPYFNLERELQSCYADVAPLVADEIRSRARAPKLKVEVSKEQSGGVLERLGGGSVNVRDDKRPSYGFREFWRDLFSKEKGGLWG
ncbi:hypothetical protein MBLNU457_6648t1 [Dothideomycetes sp. NU457]